MAEQRERFEVRPNEREKRMEKQTRENLAIEWPARVEAWQKRAEHAEDGLRMIADGEVPGLNTYERLREFARDWLEIVATAAWMRATRVTGDTQTKGGQVGKSGKSEGHPQPIREWVVDEVHANGVKLSPNSYGLTDEPDAGEVLISTWDAQRWLAEHDFVGPRRT